MSFGLASQASMQCVLSKIMIVSLLDFDIVASSAVSRG